MTNTNDGSREQIPNSSRAVRENTTENMGGSVRELNPPTPPTPPTGKDSLGSYLHPTSSTSTREPATVDGLVDSSAASPTERNPVPTPPPSNPAPSLRPVEEPCGFALVIDGEVQPCERPATGWRWYQDCGHEDMLHAACDQHENEGGRRLRAAEETLAVVERLAAIYERTADVDPTGEFRKRALDLRAALAEGASR